MLAGQNPASRSEVTVAVQQTSFVKYQGNKSLVLYCQVPQLDHFISIAIKAMVKMGKIDWDHFYVIDLARAFRPIEYLSFNAKNNDQHLGLVNLNRILSNACVLLYGDGLIKKTHTTTLDYILTPGMTSKAIS